MSTYHCSSLSFPSSPPLSLSLCFAFSLSLLSHFNFCSSSHRFLLLPLLSSLILRLSYLVLLFRPRHHPLSLFVSVSPILQISLLSLVLLSLFLPLPSRYTFYYFPYLSYRFLRSLPYLF